MQIFPSAERDILGRCWWA